MGDQHFLDLSEAPEDFFSTPLLYRRKPVNDLHQMLRCVTEKQWRKVEQNENYPWRFGHVYGPPGSGKSSASWCWAHHARNTQGCMFAYIRCNLQICYITKPDGTTSVVQLSELDALETTLFQTETDGDFARVICIFDQSLNKNIDAFIPLIVRLIKAGVGVILISSEGVRLNQGTVAGLISINHRFPGWTLEEYSAAINHQPFFDAIKNTAFGEQTVYANRDLLLEEKFLVAGHSARYMFAKSTQEVRPQISKDVSAVDPSLTQLQNALRSPSAVGTINSLMSWLFPDGNGIAPEDYAPLIFSGAWPKEDTRGDNFGRREGENTLNCFVSEYAGQKWVESTPASSAELRFMGLSLREMSVVGYGFQKHFYEVSKDAFMRRATLNVSVGRIMESWVIN